MVTSDEQQQLYDNYIRRLAAKFYLVWNEKDGLEANLEPVEDQYSSEQYIDYAKKFFIALSKLNHTFDSVEDTEEAIQSYLYEVGKEFFGKTELRQWFRCIYTVLFDSENGSRLGTLIHIIGKNEFISILNKRALLDSNLVVEE